MTNRLGRIENNLRDHKAFNPSGAQMLQDMKDLISVARAVQRVIHEFETRVSGDSILYGPVEDLKEAMKALEYEGEEQ